MCRELSECKCSQNVVMWQVSTVAQANAKERAVPLTLLLLLLQPELVECGLATCSCGCCCW